MNDQVGTWYDSKGEPTIQQINDWDAWDFYQVYSEDDLLCIMWGRQDYVHWLPQWMDIA